MPIPRPAPSGPTAAAVPPAARAAILAWYADEGRPLAFRFTRDPYAILVSEAIAQQTQAARAAERWERFIERFPTVEALASATPADVLREWQGLGYDRRAIALWRAAGMIVREHGGRVPGTLPELMALPGVGPYTARAVAAIAFGHTVGAVDVNVRRVLGRLVAASADALPAAEIQLLADAAVPPGRAGEWTHALMDIGATLCRAQAPRCDACPARPWCRLAERAAEAATTPRVAPVRRRTRAAGARSVPFASTNRWLRGRILDRLRETPDGDWIVLDGAIGSHDHARVRAAVEAMAADGVLELEPPPHGAQGVRARLPLA